MKHTFFKSLMMPALAAILLATGCTKKIDDAFANPNALTKQPVEELLPGVISNMAIQHSANGTLYGPQNDGLYFALMKILGVNGFDFGSRNGRSEPRMLVIS